MGCWAQGMGFWDSQIWGYRDIVGLGYGNMYELWICEWKREYGRREKN